MIKCYYIDEKILLFCISRYTGYREDSFGKEDEYDISNSNSKPIITPAARAALLELQNTNSLIVHKPL